MPLQIDHRYHKKITFLRREVSHAITISIPYNSKGIGLLTLILMASCSALNFSLSTSAVSSVDQFRTNAESVKSFTAGTAEKAHLAKQLNLDCNPTMSMMQTGKRN